MVHAFGWANAELVTRSQPALYCQPERMALHSTQMIDIIERYLEEAEAVSDSDPIGLVALFALRDVFPCGPGEPQAEAEQP